MDKEDVVFCMVLMAERDSNMRDPESHLDPCRYIQDLERVLVLQLPAKP
jgi:hypothetical protein